MVGRRTTDPSDKVFDADVELEYRDACVQTGDQRRWSSLKLESQRLVHRPGTVLGCAVLVAGTTIGAGILALPAVTHVCSRDQCSVKAMCLPFTIARYVHVRASAPCSALAKKGISAKRMFTVSCSGNSAGCGVRAIMCCPTTLLRLFSVDWPDDHGSEHQHHV